MQPFLNAVPKTEGLTPKVSGAGRSVATEGYQQGPGQWRSHGPCWRPLDRPVRLVHEGEGVENAKTCRVFHLRFEVALVNGAWLGCIELFKALGGGSQRRACARPGAWSSSS